MRTHVKSGVPGTHLREKGNSSATCSNNTNSTFSNEGHIKPCRNGAFNWAAVVCSAVSMLVAFTGLLGWIPSLGFLGNISPHFIPMAPTTSICFILLGLVLLTQARYQLRGWSRFSAVAVTLLLSVFGIIELAEHFTGIDVENFFIPDAGMLGLMRKARMSPATGATFFLSGVATLLVLLGETKKRQVKRICSCAGIVGSFVTITGVTILMSYLYGNPLLYGGETIPMAATTAIGFVFLGIGLVAAAGPDYMPVRLLVGHSSRAKLLRVFLLLSILIVLSHDILHRFVFVFYHIHSALLSVLLLIFFMVITGIIVTGLTGAIGRALDKAEKKQKKSAEEWTTTFNSITDWISIHNKDFKIIKANKSFTDSFNLTPEEIAGKHCYELIHGTKEPPPFCPHRQTLKTGKSSCVEFFEPNLGIHIEASTSPIFDKKGQVMASVHIAKDITERKQAEEKVQNLARFPSENPNPVLRITKDGEVLYSNKPGEQLLTEWNCEVGKTVPEKWCNLIAEAFASEQYTEVEEEVEDKIFLLTFAPVKDAGYVNLYGRDITDRKQVLYEMNERIKEINCLYSVANSIRQRDTLDEMFLDVAGLIPSGWQYPESTCSRIIFDGAEYISKPFEETEWKQISDILVEDQKRGSLEVYYMEQHPMLDEGPFLNEERNLINNIAHTLSEVITHKIAEKEIKQAKEQYETLVGNMPEAIYSALADEKGSTIFMSERWGQWTGYNTNDPEIWQKSVHPDDRERTIKVYLEAAKEKKDYIIDYRVVHKDTGEVRWVWDHGSPIVDEKGNIVRFDGIVADITERKQAEEVLRESEEKVRTLYDSSSDAIMLLDEKGFFDCNDAALRLFGCASREEFCSRHPADFSPPTQPCGSDSLTLANQRIATTMQTGHNRFEWMHKRIDSDEAFPAEVLLNAMELGGKKVLQARVYDITERKEAKDAMERLNEELKRTVEKLSAANRELKDFAYITAHDLKTPLRGIGTLAEWLATDYADKFDEEGKKQVGLLVQRSQKMYDQITGVLKFSEIGQVAHEKEEIDLNKLVEEIIKSVDPPENIQITFADKLPTLICAEIHLTQVFQNLISNAIDYTDKADGQITIGCVAEDDFWKFNVTDNGPGIEEQYFDKIFTIFQTLSAKREHRSTGIGLAIVRKAIEMYGGKIWVESSLGQGTTFFFTFPKQEMEVACNEKLEANIVG